MVAMDGCFKKFMKLLQGQIGSDVLQFLILGPENAGKTTLLYRLKFGSGWATMQKDLERMRRKPAEGDTTKEYDAGYHYEEFSMIASKCGVWDVPGCQPMRPLWPMFYRNLQIHGVFFVVDGKDVEVMDDVAHPDRKRRNAAKAAQERIAHARNLLHSLMNEDELRRAAFAVIINVHAAKDHVEAAKAKATKEDHAMCFRLRHKDLHESCKWRVKFFPLDCNSLKGEKDPEWQQVMEHCKEVLSSPESYQVDFEGGLPGI